MRCDDAQDQSLTRFAADPRCLNVFGPQRVGRDDGSDGLGLQRFEVGDVHVGHVQLLVGGRPRTLPPHHPGSPPRRKRRRTVARLDRRGVAQAVDIVGISYGGLVATELAAQHPKRVRRLVLVDSPGRCYARSDLDDDGLRDRVRSYLKGPPETVEAFLAACHYERGAYEDAGRTGVFAGLGARVAAFERQRSASVGHPPAPCGCPAT